MPTTPAAELRGITRRFGDNVAVDDLDLVVPRGTIIGLLGPNGSGKSTTLKMMLGLLAPHEGTVHLFGEAPSHAARQRVGFLPEQRGLFEDMNVRDTIAWFAELHGDRRKDARGKADAWLDRLELAERSKEKLGEFSKGMQQKVQLACALVHDPELVILDEPFSGLDPVNQGMFEEIFRDHAARGRTVMLSTHQLDQAERLLDRVAVILHGKKVVDDELHTLKHRHKTGAFRVIADGPDTWRESGVVHTWEDTPRGLLLTLAEGATSRDLMREVFDAGAHLHHFEEVLPELREIVVQTIRGTKLEGALDEEAA